MKTYEIEQTETAVIVWRGKALNVDDALDQMAQNAGYRDFASSGGDDCGLEVREVSP